MREVRYTDWEIQNIELNLEQDFLKITFACLADFKYSESLTIRADELVKVVMPLSFNESEMYDGIEVVGSLFDERDETTGHRKLSMTLKSNGEPSDEKIIIIAKEISYFDPHHLTGSCTCSECPRGQWLD